MVARHVLIQVNGTNLIRTPVPSGAVPIGAAYKKNSAVTATKMTAATAKHQWHSVGATIASSRESVKFVSVCMDMG